jgi:hypothetical protein
MIVTSVEFDESHCRLARFCRSFRTSSVEMMDVLMKSRLQVE